MRSIQQVIVVDAESKFLEFVNPAIARKLIDAGFAYKYSYEPFIVKLNRDATVKYLQLRSIGALISWH